MPRKNDAPVVQEADAVERTDITPQATVTVNALTGEVVGEGIETSDVVPEFAISIDESARRIALLKQFVQEQMKEGEDYGVIPGTSGKPTLFKPGAEKLNAIFGLAPLIEVTNRVEDWKEGFLAYEIKVTLLNKRTRELEAEGIGSCNSRERKYVKQDAANMANTILKMAKKRALVDATLSAIRASGIFTQDVEDLADNGALGGGSSSARSYGNTSRSYGDKPAAAPSSDVKSWNPAWTAKIGPCADEKEDGVVVKKGKRLDEMTEGELKWYYDAAVEGVERGGAYAAMDESKVNYIRENWPDIETYQAIEYQRGGFKRR